MGLGENPPRHHLSAGSLVATDYPIDPELEANYNNLARRPDAPELMQDWSERSAIYRSHADASIDCAYGDSERERLDIFRCGNSHAPLLVYLHGGYWQRGNKSIYSFIAEAYNQAGIDMAIIGYPLCPEVSMTQLVTRVYSALARLFRQARELGISADRISLSGHSAGGHLTAMCLTRDWPQQDCELPADLIKTAIPISGLYRLEPLRHTTISGLLNLSDAETESLSPCNLTPVHPVPTLIVVGGGESDGFFQQADLLVDAWAQNGLLLERYDEVDVDHFDVVERLADPDSELFRRASAWLS